MTDSQKLDLLLEKVTSMEGNIAEIKSDVAELKTRVTSLEKDVAELKQDVAELKTRVTSLEKDVAELKQDVAELKQDVAELKQDVADINVRLSNVESKIKVIELNLENELRVNIQRVAEGHLDLSRNLDEAKKPNQEIEILGIKVRNNESEIRNIKGILQKYALV